MEENLVIIIVFMLKNILLRALKINSLYHDQVPFPFGGRARGGVAYTAGEKT